jgi:hypothetical protein
VQVFVVFFHILFLLKNTSAWPLQPRNRISFLIKKYVRLNHDVAAWPTVRQA